MTKKIEDGKTERISRKKFDSLQKVALTDKELLEHGGKLAELHQELATIENELETLKSQFKSKIAAVETNIGREVCLVRDRFEYRNVTCERVIDYVIELVTETRLDTGEIINKRDLTESERQMEIDRVIPVDFAGGTEGGQSQAPAGTAPKIAVTADQINSAKAIILETRRATVSGIQRRMKISPTAAANIMEALEDIGFVGPANGDEPREIKELPAKKD